MQHHQVGVKIARSCPPVSHLFFADDSLVFFRATKADCLQLKKCLLLYEKASGQMVNFDKSALTFSPSTAEQTIQDIKTELSVEVVNGHELYLGLPTFSLRSKRLQFDYLRERISKKIQGWTSKFFSHGGREVMIKAVLQAIPAYAMSCFRLPASLCKKIEQICNRFWWKNSSGDRGLHWMKWAGLCKPKCIGGMGFRNFSAFNKALLAKQVWRIIHFTNSLMARILKARYFMNLDIMEARLGSNPSFVWRSILWSRDIIKMGLCWRVGDGKSIYIKADPWIPGIIGFKSKQNFMANHDIKVDTLISNDGTWNEDVVRQSFLSFEAEAILDIPLHRRGCEDVRIWQGSSNGIYSVKSGYFLEVKNMVTPQYQSAHSNQKWWRLIWRLCIPPKVRIFLWRASNDFIPTAANLLVKRISPNGICPLCKLFVATTAHCLFFCNLVKFIWKKSIFWFHLRKMGMASFLDCCLVLANMMRNEEMELFGIMVWAIWVEICKRTYGSASMHSSIRVEWAFNFLAEFQHADRLCSASASNLPTMNSSSSVWMAPAFANFRLDVDAGFDDNNSICSLGAVLRDHLGQVVKAKSSLIRHPGSVLRGELLALRLGIDICCTLGLSNVCLYSDSLQAIQSVNQSDINLSLDGSLILEIRDLIRDSGVLTARHMKRSANEAAHQLARHSLLVKHEVDWCGSDIPFWFSVITARDLIGSD